MLLGGWSAPFQPNLTHVNSNEGKGGGRGGTRWYKPGASLTLRCIAAGSALLDCARGEGNFLQWDGSGSLAGSRPELNERVGRFAIVENDGAGRIPVFVRSHAWRRRQETRQEWDALACEQGRKDRNMGVSRPPIGCPHSNQAPVLSSLRMP